jgi:hypothetical protein
MKTLLLVIIVGLFVTLALAGLVATFFPIKVGEDRDNG